MSIERQRCFVFVTSDNSSGVFVFFNASFFGSFVFPALQFGTSCQNGRLIFRNCRVVIQQLISKRLISRTISGL